MDMNMDSGLAAEAAATLAVGRDARDDEDKGKGKGEMVAGAAVDAWPQAATTTIEEGSRAGARGAIMATAEAFAGIEGGAESEPRENPQ